MIDGMRLVHTYEQTAAFFGFRAYGQRLDAFPLNCVHVRLCCRTRFVFLA